MEAFLANLGDSRRAAKRDITTFDVTGAFRQQNYSARMTGSNGLPGRSIQSLPPRSTGPANVNDVASERDFGVNIRIKPFGRRYLSAGTRATGSIPAPSQWQLAITRKTPPAARNVTVDYYASQSNMAAMTVGGEALWAMDPLHWNWLNTSLQLSCATKSPDKYFDLDPRSLWFGRFGDGSSPMGMTEYEPWDIDGAVEFERSEIGGSSARNEGWGNSPGGLALAPPPYMQKDVTVSRYGEATLVDYWEGKGIREGSRLFALLTKSAVRNKEQPGIVYSLAQKAIDTMTDGGNMYRTQSLPNAVVDVDGEDRPLQPYELHFVATSHGGALPAEYLEYVDERGFWRYDALALPLGRCLFTSPGQRLTRTPTPDALMPLRDGRRIMANPHGIRVILSPDNGLWQTI